jgi:uncharacterized protein YqjF (DUF2071 family)
MPNLRTYQITGDTPDDLEVSTESAAAYLSLKPQTLRKYRTEKLINIPYYKHPGRRGRVTYLVKDLRAYKTSLRVNE